MDLEQEVARVCAEFPGQVGVWARHLGTGETVGVHEDEEFETASSIKVVIMAAVFAQIRTRRASLTERLRYRPRHFVRGSGILRDLTVGLRLTLRDLLVLMIALSDNVATNIVIDRVGGVAAVIPDGVEPVYDLTEPATHAFVANGLVVHNCAEQPLPAWGVCTLGHVNLAAHWNAATHDVDWAALEETVRLGVRFLDDVVDATPYFFPENRAQQQRERRIGLGTLGLGELLIRLGLRYGSPESVAFCDTLFREQQARKATGETPLEEHVIANHHKDRIGKGSNYRWLDESEARERGS